MSRINAQISVSSRVAISLNQIHQNLGVLILCENLLSDKSHKSILSLLYNNLKKYIFLCSQYVLNHTNTYVLNVE
jgi:hypothetical protein